MTSTPRKPVTSILVQPGDFACVPVAGSVGVLIEFGQFLAGQKFQPYEHAEVYIGSPPSLPKTQWGYTASAYPDRKGIKPLECAPQDLPGALWSTPKVGLTSAERDGIVAWCLAHPAVEYSAADYIALAAHRFHINARLLQQYIANDKSYICSQYVDSAYQFGGSVHLFNDGRWPGFVMPMDLASLLESMPVAG